MKYLLKEVMAHCQDKPALWHQISHNHTMSPDFQHIETTVAIPELAEVKPQSAIADAPWPIWARILAKLRRPGEIGVGDTLARLIRIFHRRKPSKGCGCPRRHSGLNAHFPY